MKKFISFSGGVESTTMCILYGKGAKAIWCDTGAEHDLMYSRIDFVESELKKLHGGDFELIRVRNKKYIGLEAYAQYAKYMPSGQQRYCTRLFKIEPIDDFLSEQGECELMIGFNYDEQGRTGNLELKSNVKYTYPLIENGLDRGDCESILKVYGLHPEFPIYMSRGGCRMCFFKTEKEYKALYFFNQPEFEQLIKFEEGLQDKRKKFRSILQTGKSLRQLAAECEREKMFLNIEDMRSVYNKTKTETSCGAFCHR